MMIERLLSLYLNLNVVLLIAALIWQVTRYSFSPTPLKHAYLTQLRLAYGVLGLVALCPAMIFALQSIPTVELWARGKVPNASDLVVAQFLDGKIAMAPTRFEELLMTRSELTRDIASLATPAGQALAAALFATLSFGVIKLTRSALGVARTIRGAYVMRRIGRIDIRITPTTTVPFSTRGLWRHYIVLPTSMLSQSNDLRIAVSHELQHMRQGDLVWEILMETARPLFFWNPAFAYWKHQIETLRELSCDQQVLHSNKVSVREYGECLLRVCAESLLRAQLKTPSVPFAQLDTRRHGSTSARFLRLRVNAMLSERVKPGAPMLGISFAVILGVSVIAGALFAHPNSGWTQDRLMLSAIVNLERLDTRNGVQN